MAGHRARLLQILAARYPGATGITMPATTQTLIAAEVPLTNGKFGTYPVTVDNAMADGTWRLDGTPWTISGLILPDVVATPARAAKEQP